MFMQDIMNNLNVPIDKNFTIRVMQANDLPQVRSIYLDGIGTRNATFEVSAPDSWQEWDSKYISRCRFVAVSGDRVLGWIMISQVSNRLCYAGVAEISVYVANSVQSKGVGYKLLSTLITDAEENGFWTLQAGIFPENKASLALHQKCGFRQVGVREKIAMLDGKWRDMLLLERRSKKFI